MDDIDKVIKDEKEKGTPAPSDDKSKEPTNPDPELEKKKAELAELETAKASALEELQRIRDEKRKAKKGESEEDELPQIDDADPSVKAWDHRIKREVAPVQQELEKEKAEIRQFAFDKFLADKPSLAKDPTKLKELMATYERIRTASERTTEGVLLDLDKAYAAIFHKELLEAARQGRVDDAKASAIFSDIAVSRGSTAQNSPKAPPVKLSEEDKLILARWGLTPEEWADMKKKQSAEA